MCDHAMLEDHFSSCDTLQVQRMKYDEGEYLVSGMGPENSTDLRPTVN